jgi:uncharacterized protein (TIGR02001 family)
MKKLTLSLILALASAGGSIAVAQTATTPAPAPAPAATPAPEAAPSYSIVLTPSVVSQYMFRGARLGGPSFQPSVEFDAGSLAIGVWSNFPIDDKVQGQSDPEIDPYGSYTFTINDSLSIVPGFTWYNYPDADKNAGFYKSTFEPSLAVNYTVKGIKFTPKLYYDVVLDGPTYELTVSYALALPDAGSELDFAATAGTFKWKDAFENTSPQVKNWGDYWQVGVSAPFTVTKNSKFIIGVAYTEGSGNYLKQGTDGKVKNTAAVGRGVITASYAITF